MSCEIYEKVQLLNPKRIHNGKVADLVTNSSVNSDLDPLLYLAGRIQIKKNSDPQHW